MNPTCTACKWAAQLIMAELGSELSGAQLYLAHDLVCDMVWSISLAQTDLCLRRGDQATQASFGFPPKRTRLYGTQGNA